MKYLCACAIVLATACDGPKPAHIGDAVLAQATGVYQPPEGQTLVISAGKTEVPAELEPVVRVAFDDNLTFGTVEKVLAELEQRGVEVHLLVGKRRDIAAMKLEDQLEGPAIRLVGELDGKACVAPPGVIEAKCVQSSDRKHISRAYVRELTNEAVREYGLRDIEAYIPKQLDWANVVRIIDGARTCCQWSKTEPDLTTRVKLVDPPQAATAPQ
jgi:hypothetical protein